MTEAPCEEHVLVVGNNLDSRPVYVSKASLLVQSNA
jgi:hypothetical protein